MSLFAIALKYVGRKLDKVRLYDSVTREIKEIDAKEVKLSIKSKKLTISNLVLDGTKFAGLDGLTPRLTKYVDDMSTGEEYLAVLNTIGNTGFKCISPIGQISLIDNNSAFKYAERKQLNNASPDYYSESPTIKPLVGSFELGTSGNKVESVAYNTRKELMGYFLNLGGRTDFKEVHRVSSFGEHYLENAKVALVKGDGRKKKDSYTLELSEELPKLYLVPRNFYEKFYESCPQRTTTQGVAIEETGLDTIIAKSGISNIDLYASLFSLDLPYGDANSKYNTTVQDILSKYVSNTNLDILATTLRKLKEDELKSPWGSNKWGKTFRENNIHVGLSFKDAPLNIPLMTVDYEFGTIYKDSRGTGLSQCSVVIKLSEDLIYCVAGSYWQVSSSGTSSYTYSQKGYFSVSDSMRGTVRPLNDVNLSDKVGILEQEQVVPKAVRLVALILNKKIAGYRFVLDDSSKFDLDLEVANSIGLVGFKCESAIALVPHNDEYLTPNEIRTGLRVEDISENPKRCAFYAKNILELNK